MNNTDFAQVVSQTLAELPEEFKSQLDNVEVVIDNETVNPSLLGLYHGVPKTERYSYFALPDKITIYKKAIETIATTPEEIKKEIRETVLHEIGHHFGLDDIELDALKKK